MRHVMDVKHVDPDDEDLPWHPRQVVLMVDDNIFHVMPFELLTKDEVAAIREFNMDYTEHLLGYDEPTPVTRKVETVVHRMQEKGVKISVSALADYEIKLAFEVVKPIIH